MLKSVLKKYVILLAAFGFMLAPSLLGIASVNQRAEALAQDCDGNAVIYCGVSDLQNLKNKYKFNQGGDLHAIYKHFGIPNEAAMNGMVMGRVTKTNEVWIGNTKVATGAVTAGRHRMGADEVQVPGATAFMRPPSRSFRSESLPALVKMSGRHFDFAVIMSCGNPVSAMNRDVMPPPPPPPPAPEPPKPEPPKPQPEPKYSCDLLDVEKGEDRTVTATLSTTAQNGATFKDATYFWGDGESTRTADTTVSHEYDEAGTYDITATAHFTVNGKEVSSTSQACKKSVTFEEEQPPEEPKNPKLEITKDVRLEGQATWEPELVESEPGGQLEYRVTVTNTGEAALENVLIQDSLPSGLSFDEDQILQGSPEVTDKTVADLIGDGIVVSSIAPGESIEISFSVTVLETTDACEEPLRNVAVASANDVPEDEDDAFVKVCQPEKPEEPEEPEQPQVQGKQTPPPSGKLPDTGPAGVVGIFSASSFLGLAAYKLKDFYLFILR